MYPKTEFAYRTIVYLTLAHICCCKIPSLPRFCVASARFAQMMWLVATIEKQMSIYLALEKNEIK